MGNFLDAPNTAKDSHYYESSSGLKIGVTGMQGWRLEMEDAHISIDMPSKKDHTLVAVFDGHGGAGSAKFAAQHMINFIERTQQWTQYIGGGCQDLRLLEEALEKAFEDIDSSLRMHQENNLGGQPDSSGCTSNVAMITPEYIVCANAGDSRCVLGTNSTATGLSNDHKPSDASEKRRIEAAGGFVQYKRVDGDLAVSRALGDFQYKTRNDLPYSHQKVTCKPDITKHRRSSNDEVLLLACDGLWDVMNNDAAIEFIRSMFQYGEKNAQTIAEEMVDIALERGSRDNISAIVVPLEGASYGPLEAGGVEKYREERMNARESAQSIGSNREFITG